MSSSRNTSKSLRDISVAVCAAASLLVIACSDDGGQTGQPPLTAAGTGAPAVPVTMPGLCAAGQTECAGACTNLQSDGWNCGRCGNFCGASGICIAGQCACASTQTVCANGCSDTATDALNCGGCGRACQPGQMCQLGSCVSPSEVCTPACLPGQRCVNNVCTCPAPTSLCGGACVDPNTTPSHCGQCDAPCRPGQLCQAGSCVCPAGQVACGEECVDLQLSSKHCGMCGEACGENEACMAGVCRAPLGADGCSGEPRDLTIEEVAVFQTVKVPLSDGLTPIAPAMRTPVIQNRPSLFRVYVAPRSGFMPREFSARVTIKNGTGEDQYFAKQRVAGASREADTASTFQIAVPREKILADTRYSVELVECGAGAPPSMVAAGAAAPPAAGGGGTGAGDRGGSAAPPTGASGTRFPATGDTPLAAVDTGTLKIKLVPLVVGSRRPDTSEAGLKVYKDYMEAMYPVDKVEFSVAAPLTVSTPVNWNRMLEQLRAQRQRDMVASDEYYYGLLRPTERFAEFCRGGCTAGVAYIGSVRQTATRVGMGLAYGDEMSAGIMAHEVGHSHGRAHAPCAPGNQIQSVDSNYPHQRAATGVWAYDIRSKKFIEPMMTRDIMGYCEPKWISDYTYEALLDRSETINTQMLSLPDPAARQAYRVLLLDVDGPQWSVPFPRPDLPFGKAETADVLDTDNQPIEKVTVYRTEIGDSSAFTILVPEPRPGWNSIKLHDALPLPFSAPVTIPEP